MCWHGMCWHSIAFSCVVCMYCVHVLCTCTVYMYCAHLLCAVCMCCMYLRAHVLCACATAIHVACLPLMATWSHVYPRFNHDFSPLPLYPILPPHLFCLSPPPFPRCHSPDRTVCVRPTVCAFNSIFSWIKFTWYHMTYRLWHFVCISGYVLYHVLCAMV